MRVLVCAVSHATGISGVQRHALNLVRALGTQAWMQEMHVVLGPWQQTMMDLLRLARDPRLHLHIADVRRDAIARNLWHLRGLPILARDMEPDLIHLTYPVPINRHAIRQPIVVTLHDLYPHEIPSNFGSPKCLANQWILNRCLGAVDSIACVSASTLSALSRYFRAEVVSKAVQIPNCVEGDGPLDELTNPPCEQPFLLCVAQHRRNKNICFLLRTFHEMRFDLKSDMKLVIVGMDGPESARIRESIRCLGLAGRVRLIDQLSEAELRWCYGACDAVLAPSITEGFGLPVVEALQQGARVVCSDIPAFREFGAEGCRLVPLAVPDAEHLFAKAVFRSLAEPKPRALVFPRLSCAAVGDAYRALYHGLLVIERNSGVSCGSGLRRSVEGGV